MRVSGLISTPSRIFAANPRDAPDGSIACNVHLWGLAKVCKLHVIELSRNGLRTLQSGTAKQSDKNVPLKT